MLERLADALGRAGLAGGVYELLRLRRRSVRGYEGLTPYLVRRPADVPG